MEGGRILLPFFGYFFLVDTPTVMILVVMVPGFSTIWHL